MRMEAVERDILVDLEELDDDISQYAYLIACARECRRFPEQLRTQNNLIKDCQVSTWMYAAWNNGRCRLEVDSESLLIKGGLALLQEIYDGRSKDELQGYHCGILHQQIFTKHFTRGQLMGLKAVIRHMEGE